MKIFNKNNFRIHSLSRGYNGYLDDRVHVTSDFTEVTNGHYLIRVYSKEEKEDLPSTDTLKPSTEKIDTIIPADSAKEIERAIPKNQHHTLMLNHAWPGQNTNKDQIEFICTDLETWKPIVARKIDDRYPQTNSIISGMSKKKPKTEICFSSEYMEKLCQQFKKSEIRQVKLSIYGPEQAMKLEGKSQGDQKILAVLMPMRE